MDLEDWAVREWLRVLYADGTRYVKATDLAAWSRTSPFLPTYSNHKAGAVLAAAEPRGWVRKWGRGRTHTWRICEAGLGSADGLGDE